VAQEQQCMLTTATQKQQAINTNQKNVSMRVYQQWLQLAKCWTCRELCVYLMTRLAPTDL